MGVVLSKWSVTIAFSLLVMFLCLFIYFKQVTSKYWFKRNITHLKPVFLLGNAWKANIFENINQIIMNFHIEHKTDKLLGIWLFNKPALVVTDPDLTKRILIKDFNYFRDRGIDLDPKTEPLSAHLFILRGVQWRNLRVKLTPTFTSGKMKMMFPIMVKCGEQLRNHLRTVAEKKESVEVKDLLARFTTDVISSCAFGIETNSLQNPKSEFREFGKDIFKFNLKSILINSIMITYPKLLKIFSIQVIPKDASDFFINSVRETIEYREKNNVTRNDFLQLLIQLIKTGKVEDVDKKAINALEMDGEELEYKFSLNDAAAQCFVFFAAGFETSSTAITFALYELALNPDIQKRLQKEIDETAERCENEQITYDEICRMEYLDRVVQETLRKYPPVGNLQRKCTEDYYIPELNVKIDRGTLLFISVSGFHHDPDMFPDPEKFDPERFSPEEKKKRENFVFLPFGDGPRNCIGNRFGLMQVKIGLTSILKDYNVEVCNDTPIPIRLNPRSFTPVPIGGIPLNFSKRN